MSLTVLVDREAKKEVGDCPVDAMMRVMGRSMERYDFMASVEGRIR
jgi:hypothetical protein